jgi:hypothetical protein
MAIEQTVNNPWIPSGWAPKSTAVRSARREPGNLSSPVAPEEETLLFAQLVPLVDGTTSDISSFREISRLVTEKNYFEQPEQLLTAARDFLGAPPGFRLPTANSTSKLAVWLSTLVESTPSAASTGAVYKDVPEHISHQLNDLLRLPDNWDDEGSSRFTGVHVTRVKNWLADLFRTYGMRHGRSPSHPRIAEAYGPSIDVYWRSKEFTLLINFPSDANEPCTFYGFNPEGKEEFQGKVGVGALADRISSLIGDLI